jgi:hypothetical protein
MATLITTAVRISNPTILIKSFQSNSLSAYTEFDFEYRGDMFF